jgi:hypothetical protein
MSKTATHSTRAGHRYNWCPSCHELWGAAWMAAARVNRCPACDCRVLTYIGRSPYDRVGPGSDDTSSRSSRRQGSNLAGFASLHRWTA